MEFPFVQLPDHFTKLLRVNMQTSGRLYNELTTYAHERPPFNALIEQTFRTMDQKFNISRIVKALGWHGFRDCLASNYIEKAAFGKYPISPNQHICNDILNLEEQLKPYSVSGFSRGFLLGFYLKMVAVAMMGEDGVKPREFVSDKTISLLKTCKKEVRIDWLVLLLVHFERYLGHDQVSSYIADKKDFKFMYSQLTDKQSTAMMNNFLSYAASINEEVIFLDQTV